MTSSYGTPDSSHQQYTLDCIFTLVGFGPWTALCCSMSFLVEALCAVIIYGADFMVPPHHFSCLVSDELGGTTAEFEDKCFITRSNGSQEQCQEFVFKNTTYVNTVTMEFGLVCSKENLRFVFQLMITIAGLFGTLCAGVMSNKWGRQKTIWLCSVMILTSTILNVTVPVFWVIMLTRFLVGFFLPPLHMASFILGMEVCPLKYRTYFGTLSLTPFGVMVSGIAGIAYQFRDWRLLQLLGSWPLIFLVVLANPLFLSESPRWLVSRGRVQQAERILTRAARFNKTTSQLPNNLEKHLNLIYEEQAQDESASSRDLLLSMASSPEMRTTTFASVTLFLVNGALCMSIPLRANVFESAFLYVILLGVLQLISYLSVGPILNKMGRTKFISLSMAVATILQIALAALLGLNNAGGIAPPILSAISFGFAEGSFLASLVLCSEVFPTSVRSHGMALSYFGLNCGYILPSVLDLITPSSMPWVSLAVFSMFSAVGAGTVLVIPETNHQPLLQAVPKSGH